MEIRSCFQWPKASGQSGIHGDAKAWKQVLGKGDLVETEPQKSRVRSTPTGTVSTALLWRERVEQFPLKSELHLMDP